MADPPKVGGPVRSNTSNMPKAGRDLTTLHLTNVVATQVTNETTSGESTMSATSSGLGSSPPASREAVLHNVDDDEVDVEDNSGLQTKKLVSACNNAVQRLSSPTSDSDHIELDGLARQDRNPTSDSVEQPSSPSR